MRVNQANDSLGFRIMPKHAGWPMCKFSRQKGLIYRKNHSLKGRVRLLHDVMVYIVFNVIPLSSAM